MTVVRGSWTSSAAVRSSGGALGGPERGREVDGGTAIVVGGS